MIVTELPHRGRQRRPAGAPAQRAPADRAVGRGARRIRQSRWPPDRAIETDLAYILYTSGSTGTPEGRDDLPPRLAHLRRVGARPAPGWASRTGSAARRRCISTCRSSTSSPPARPPPAWSCSPEMTAIFPARLAQWMERERISVWYSVPSVLTHARLPTATCGEFDLSRLRAVIFAGEVFPAKHLARLMAELPTPALPELVRADRDQRVHLVRGARQAALTAAGPDRQGLRQHRRVRGHQRRRPGIQARRGRRAVRAGPRADARLLGPAGQDRRGAGQQPVPGGLRRARLPDG